jgi:hypothetical protein
MARAAVHPRYTFEVWVRPAGSIKTNAGQMTTFDIRINPQPTVRQGADRMLAMQAQAPALPAPGASGQGDAADDDIPF